MECKLLSEAYAVSEFEKLVKLGKPKLNPKILLFRKINKCDIVINEQIIISAIIGGVMKTKVVSLAVVLGLFGAFLGGCDTGGTGGGGTGWGELVTQPAHLQ